MKYRILEMNEQLAAGYDETHSVLVGPDGFEAALCEPEDRLWTRDGASTVSELNRLESQLAAANAEIAAYKAAAPLCAEHQPNGGTRSGCLVCELTKQGHALSNIDYACGEPNDMGCSQYAVDLDAARVEQRVKGVVEELRAANAELERWRTTHGCDDPESSLLQDADELLRRQFREKDAEIASLKTAYDNGYMLAVSMKNDAAAKDTEIERLKTRNFQLDSYLEHTADGVVLAEADKLYCPECGGEVKQDCSLCYCWACDNPDDGCWPHQGPMPLSYESTYADPAKRKAAK